MKNILMIVLAALAFIALAEARSKPNIQIIEIVLDKDEQLQDDRDEERKRSAAIDEEYVDDNDGNPYVNKLLYKRKQKQRNDRNLIDQVQRLIRYLQLQNEDNDQREDTQILVLNDDDESLQQLEGRNFQNNAKVILDDDDDSYEILVPPRQEKKLLDYLLQPQQALRLGRGRGDEDRTMPPPSKTIYDDDERSAKHSRWQ